MSNVVIFVLWLIAGIFTLCSDQIHKLNYACLWLAHLLLLLPDVLTYAHSVI